MHPDTPRDLGSSTFLVLGASGGIGSAVVRQLRGNGAKLLLAGRDEARLSRLAEETRSAMTVFDAVDFAAVENAVAQARELGGGRLDGIASCVGSLLLKPAHRTSASEWHAVLDTNLGSAFAVVRAAGALMREPASIVFCSSAAATLGMANHEAIAAAKAGIEGLVRAAASTYSGRGLRFHAVAPGLVRTELARPALASERLAESSRAAHAVGRIGEPDDVASAIVWLLRPENSWLTGQVLHVDGGLARVRPVPRA